MRKAKPAPTPAPASAMPCSKELTNALRSLGLTEGNLTAAEIEAAEKEIAETGTSPTLKAVVCGLTGTDVSRYCEINPKGFQYDYLVVGAGLFGATFANIAHAHGKRVLVIDRRPYIGGNAHSEQSHGIEVHTYGPHIFHTNSEKVWNYITRFARFNSFVNRPLALSRGRIYSLPMNMHTFNRMWGVTTPDEAKYMIMRHRGNRSEETAENAREMAISLFGRKIYRRLIKGYTEKQWGRRCTQLPPDIMRRLPVRFTYDGNYFNATHQGIPVGGYTAMMEKMLRGVVVRLNTDYIAHRDELDALAEKVVYTGPLDELMGYRFGPLEYRSLRFETSLFSNPNIQGNAVVNYCDRSVPYTRVIEYKHFTPENTDIQSLPHTVLMHEFPAEWKVGKEPYYPVRDAASLALYARYRQLVAQLPKEFIIGGRLAEYRYYNMDEAIESALRAAEREFGK